MRNIICKLLHTACGHETTKDEHRKLVDECGTINSMYCWCRWEQHQIWMLDQESSCRRKAIRVTWWLVADIQINLKVFPNSITQLEYTNRYGDYFNNNASVNHAQCTFAALTRSPCATHYFLPSRKHIDKVKTGNLSVSSLASGYPYDHETGNPMQCIEQPLLFP